MRTATCIAAALLPLLCVLAPARARAVEVAVAGKPLLIDVTNTAIFNYHFDNRNTAPSKINTLLDDNYGEWLDRFNVEASFWRFRLGFRLDGAAYAGAPSVKGADALVFDQNPDAPNDYRNQIVRELHNRYVSTLYPSKLFVGYIQPGVELTLGDFYAQLGRGLVFSVRKIDELAVDTTVRGGKVVAERDFGSFHLGGTLFVGQMNPLRVDENSGRRLDGEGSPLFFGFPRASELDTVVARKVSGGVFVPINRIERGAPSYLEDTVLGARIEGGPQFVVAAVNASVLARRSHTADLARCPLKMKDTVEGPFWEEAGICKAQFPDFRSTDQAKQHNTIVTFSGSLNFPSIKKHGDLYLEAAGQQLRDGHLTFPDADKDLSTPPTPEPDLSGYAIYGAGSITGGPVSFSLEGKHYRRFFPLSGNIDTTTKGFGAPEFNLITYSQPPTAEPIYVEPVSGAAPNVCISGGRGRVDYRYHRDASVYAWLGRYASFSELNSNNSSCQIDDKLQSNTWDIAVGTDLGLEKGASHVRAWIGARTTDSVVAFDTLNSGLTTTFYREGYLRYDLVKHLSGAFSLELQGFHRHRFEPVSFAAAWTEGENYTALQWSPHFSAVLGYEYKAQEGCQAAVAATRSKPAIAAKDLCHYVNGGVQWRSQSKGGVTGMIFDTVSVFVGQRRGAVRCVSGVCRQFPPFEGAKLELTSRF